MTRASLTKKKEFYCSLSRGRESDITAGLRDAGAS